MAIYRGPGGTGDTTRGESVEGPNTTITQLTGIEGPIKTPTYIEFNQTADPVLTKGQIGWNSEEGTLDVGLNLGNVVLQVGEETLYRVVNMSGSTINHGTLVMADGTVGNSGKIKIVPWNGTAAPNSIMGLTTEDIPNDENGYVTHFGKVRGIQTNGGNYSQSWVNGDIIYAGPTGGLTKVKPSAPKTKTTVAIVVNAHPSNGTLFVRPSLSSNLGDDDLVQLSSLTNGDILEYNSANARFENVANTSIQPGDNVSELTNDVGYSTTVGTVTSIDVTAGTGVSVSGGPITSSGSITVTNTAPDQTVVLTAGTGISVSGTYPSFTVTNTEVGGVTDGDKGDITVSSSGSVWTIDAGAVDLTTKVTGTLPVANGGTGVTSSTGSGNVVLSTSPTLVTPALGTPSSATLTNATGLPIEAGTTGTLGVARGGTGATTLTANNVLLGNGTSAPLTVAPGSSGNLLTSNGTTWTSSTPPSGGQYLGAAATKAIAYNAQTIAEDITVGATQNGLSAGPITIDSTYTVTVDSGGTWVIV